MRNHGGTNDARWLGNGLDDGNARGYRLTPAHSGERTGVTRSTRSTRRWLGVRIGGYDNCKAVGAKFVIQ